jgi:hypothetical protein
MAAQEKRKHGMSRKDALSHRAPGAGECGNCEASRPLSPNASRALVTEKIFFFVVNKESGGGVTNRGFPINDGKSATWDLAGCLSKA